MGLDLEMCIVPRHFENVLLKWRSNLEYAEWIADTQRILTSDDFHTFNDPVIEELKRDVLKLRDFYDYQDEDFFEESGRESSTLDYIFTGITGELNYKLPDRFLWQGGERIEGCQSVQGQTLTLFNFEQISDIDSFFQSITAEIILKKYDYEAMRSAGVYKLTHPDHTYILAESFSNLKKLFRRAFLKDVYILRNIY